jgi:Na+-transporting NADH:ubiquinone oxidoreductase subunit B
MKSLRKWIDNLYKKTEKGQPLHFLRSSVEALDTFLFVPNKVTTKGAHIRDYIDLKRTMIIVVIAIIPAMIFGWYNTGYQHFLATGQEFSTWQALWYGLLKFLPLLIVSYGVGGIIEVIFAQIRHEEVNEGYLVTGLLIPLIVPVDIPLWILAIGVAFAVIFAKEVFGGTGMNVFNPALVARAFLFFAYPTWMSGSKVWISGLTEGKGIIDGYSGATILGQLAEGSSQHVSIVNGLGHPISAMDMFLGLIPGSIGETSTLAILIGAAILLLTGIGSWRVMLSVFAGGYLMALLFNVIGGNPLMEFPAWQHLLVGGFAFGAVFMATDPVTMAQTNKGKFIYGFLIGAFAIMIRVLNPAYPEGMMLSILLMNMFAPLIDHIIIQNHIKKRIKRWNLNTQNN